MDIAPIKTQRDYKRALKEIKGLMDAKRNTPRGDRLDVLVALVEAWEAKRSRSTCPMPWKPSSIMWINKALPPATSFPSSAAAIGSTRCWRASGR